MDKDNMSEKTAEDRLREELDGEITTEARPKIMRASISSESKKRSVRPRTSGRKTDVFSGLGQRVDSFVEDFEKKVADSLNDVSSPGSGRVRGRTETDGRGVLSKADKTGVVRDASSKVENTRKPASERGRMKGHSAKAYEHAEVEPLESILGTSRIESGRALSEQGGLQVELGSAFAPSDERLKLEPGLTEPAVDAQPQPELTWPAVDALPQPELTEPAVETQPQPEVTEPAVETLPQPELTEPAVDAQPQPELTEPAVDIQPQPEVTEPAVDAQPQPEVSEPAVDEQPQPEVSEPAVDEQPQPEVSEPAVDTQSQPELTEPAVDIQPQPEVTEPAVETLPQPELTEPAVDTQSQPELTEPAVDIQPQPEVTEPAVETLPQPELTEPAVETLPQPELTEPAVDIQPQPEVTEPAVDAQPQPELTEPAVDELTQTGNSEPLDETKPSTLDEFPVDLVSEPDTDNPDEEFPDIPVLEAQEISSDQDEHNTELPDIPVISSEEDNFADITDIDDDIHEFSEDPEDSAQNFAPFADVVLNVDSELPNLNETPAEFDPENESSPVAVTMPESTKTAEDKLMADIAEAMTGSPLSLDTHDPSEPYRLPDNFLSTPQDSQPQSAEEKLIANISQAMSESPIGIAQNNANQNLEDDLNPFEEMPVPEPTPTIDIDYDEQEEQEDEDYDEPFLPDFSAAQEQIDTDEKPAEEPVDDINIDDLPDPFAMQDLRQEDDSPSDEQNKEESSLLDDDISIDESPAEIEPEPEPEAEPEPVNLDKAPEIEVEPEPEDEPVHTDEFSEPESQPVTAEERFAQELAGFVQQDSLNLTEPEPEPDPESEAEPEQSLIDDPEITTSAIDDDDFMSSWGEAAAAVMNFRDEEAEALQTESQPVPEPVPETEPAFQPEPEPEPAPAVNAVTEAQENSSPKTKRWRIISQVLLALLLGLGVTALIFLYNLTGKLASTINPALTVSPYGSYDYAIDRVDDSGIAASMKLRGIEGWKLVSSRRIQDEVSGNFGYEFIFMRASPVR